MKVKPGTRAMTCCGKQVEPEAHYEESGIVVISWECSVCGITRNQLLDNIVDQTQSQCDQCYHEYNQGHSASCWMGEQEKASDKLS